MNGLGVTSTWLAGCCLLAEPEAIMHDESMISRNIEKLGLCLKLFETFVCNFRSHVVLSFSLRIHAARKDHENSYNFHGNSYTFMSGTAVQ